MNIAILFDSMDDNCIKPETLLCGQEMYLYSLKQMLTHPEMDAIVMAWREEEIAQGVYERITHWKEAGEIKGEKEIKILHGTENFQEILTYLGKNPGKEINTYVLHSTRYPLLTQKMLDNVLQSAKQSGIAVTTQKSDEELVTEHEQRTLQQENYRIVKYPAAIRRNHPVLEKLYNFSDILQKMADCHPTRCETENRNIAIASLEDCELAEAVIRIKGEARRK